MRWVDWLDTVDLRKLICLAIIVVFAFGAIYHAVDLHYPEEGIEVENHTFLNSIYFSVVTFSSLGYGDIAPLGFSRFLASLEVIIGLIFIGLFVSRMASWRHEKILNRMYQREYVNHIREIIDHISTYRQGLLDLTQAYEKEPENKDLQKEMKTHFATKDNGYLEGIASFLERSKSFLSRQVSNDPESIKSVDSYYWERLMHSISITLREVQGSLERLKRAKYPIKQKMLVAHINGINKHAKSLTAWIAGQAPTKENLETKKTISLRATKIKNLVK